jgi:hypothetical protein
MLSLGLRAISRASVCGLSRRRCSRLWRSVPVRLVVAITPHHGRARRTTRRRLRSSSELKGDLPCLVSIPELQASTLSRHLGGRHCPKVEVDLAEDGASFHRGARTSHSSSSDEEGGRGRGRLFVRLRRRRVAECAETTKLPKNCSSTSRGLEAVTLVAAGSKNCGHCRAHNEGRQN